MALKKKTTRGVIGTTPRDLSNGVIVFYQAAPSTG